MARRTRAEVVDLAKLWGRPENGQQVERRRLTPPEQPDTYCAVCDNDGFPAAELVECREHGWWECRGCHDRLHVRDIAGSLA